MFIPAWDEAAIIAPMLRATLDRFEHGDYRLFVGHYRNDPATQAAIDSVSDPRIVAVEVDANGPTTKADCLNRLYAALTAYEAACDRPAKAVVLHDAEDLVHPLELKLFDRMIERAGAVQLPVAPLIDPESPWVAGHYADEFAESHMKELVVREAVGAAIPLAGVGCAIERVALSRLARRGPSPFASRRLQDEGARRLSPQVPRQRTARLRRRDYPGGRFLGRSTPWFCRVFPASVRPRHPWTSTSPSPASRSMRC